MLSRFSPRMQRVLINNLKYDDFRDIQQKAVPRIFDGENVLIIAPTATGKTEAFLLPIMDMIYSQRLSPTSMLYISPIKALINNQDVRFQTIGSYIDIDVFKWHGDINRHWREKYLEEPTDILLITPESLEVILFSDDYNPAEIFANVKFVVIDEIHAFAGDERGVHLLSLLERIQRFSNFQLQRIGVSATIGNPEEMAKWLQGSSDKPVIPVIDEGKRRTFFKLKYYDKINESMCKNIYAEARGGKSLFFTNSRSETEMLNKIFQNYPIETYNHHSSVDKYFREKAEEIFRSSGRKNMIIFCTSTLELGIDIGDLDRVFHLGPPYRAADFLQRVGRSGRRNNISETVIYNIRKKDLLRSIALINLLKKDFVESVEFRKKAWDIMFHQIIMLVHQEYQVSENKIYSILKNVYSFKDITDKDFAYLINYMIENDYLIRYKDKLMIGGRTEKEFGFANYYNFFSVFDSINEYTIVANGQVIGTLDAFFINTRKQSDIHFFLARKMWKIKSINHKRLRIYVEAAEKGKIPFWLSEPQMLSRPLSEEIYNVLCDEEEYPFLGPTELALLKKERKKYKIKGFRKGSLLMEEKDNCVTIHSYAGDRINLTLGLILKENTGADKFSYSFNKISLYFSDKIEDLERIVEDFLLAFRDQKLLINARFIRKILDEISVKRISKFYDYLPPLLQKEMIEEIFIDIEGSIDFLREKELIYLKKD
ncbi:MAG TPA: DEAD/DEAH box helicase [Halanaerobiales bacterium]|nr:DEAD/DEAH box helicase [Halanaerobiales bacterium]HQD04949.1 DEAD/DEAH box helicase [Halanaerobiales bacterium]